MNLAGPESYRRRATCYNDKVFYSAFHKGEAMGKFLAVWICAVFLILPLTGCSTLNHNIGSGAPEGTEVASDRQWYILWGLIPLNNVDGAQLAQSKGLTNNYTIQSQVSFLDCIINFFTDIVSVTGQTVRVLANSNGSAAPAAAAAPAAGSASLLATANQAAANKDFNGALQDYQAAANADPNSAQAYQGMGICYYYLGQKSEALTAFQKALSLDPNNTQLANFVKTMQ
jgi:hypothetical protein